MTNKFSKNIFCHELYTDVGNLELYFKIQFLRKLQYCGYFIEEIVDRDKIHAYFNFFQEYNHLFKEFTFDYESLSKFD